MPSRWRTCDGPPVKLSTGGPDRDPCDVTILTSGHDVADARLHRHAGALVRAGLRTEVLALGEPGGAPTGVRTRTWPRRTLLHRACLAARLGWSARGSVLLALDPDSLVGARIAARFRGRAVVADVHEDYGRLLADRPWAHGVAGWVARCVVQAADRAAATCALTLVADDHVPPSSARQRMVVRNEADLRLVGEPAAPTAAPRAAYVGDVRASRGLFTMLDALEAAPGWHLDVVGPVAAQDIEALQERLNASTDLVGRTTWHGRLDPASTWDVVRSAWVGLCLLADTPAFHDALPSKLPEYLAAGLVPITTDLPRSAHLVRAAGVGHVVPTNPEAAAAETAARLREIGADPPGLVLARRRAVAWARASTGVPSGYDAAAAAIGVLVHGG